MKDSTSVALSVRFVGIFAFCVLAIAIPAQAATVYSTGFETFTIGDLHGQDSWQASSWTNFGESSAVTPSIQTGVAKGTRAVEIPLQDDADEVEAAWRTFTDPTGTNKIVTITQEIYISASVENSFQIELSGSSNVTNFVEFGGDGEIYVNSDTTSTTHTWTAGAWKSLKIVMDFNLGTMDVCYDSTWVADDVAFLNTDGFEKYSIWSLYPGADGTTMYLDDLDITAVPEPTCLVLLGLGMSACLVRRRKS